MVDEIWFDRIPLAAVFVGSMAIVFLAIAAGFIFGCMQSHRVNATLMGPISSVTVALLGLLAFFLATTFGMASSRYFARRQILLSEVNAIETTFLRANLIAEPHRTQCQEFLKKYVSVRASLAPDVRVVSRMLEQSELLQSQLWQQATDLAKSHSNPVIDALFIASLNNLIDLHTMRTTTALQYHIPISIWVSLLFLAVIATMAVGYQFGLSNAHSYIIYLVLALGISVTITMIADFDSITKGSLLVSQRPMQELQQRLNGGVK
jgi:hypothetical protein